MPSLAVARVAIVRELVTMFSARTSSASFVINELSEEETACEGETCLQS